MSKFYFKFLCIQFIKLEFTIVFVYILAILKQKFRHLLLPAFIFLPMAVSSLEVRAGGQSNYAMLLPGVMLGIAFAYEEWFEKLRSYKEQNSFIWRSGRGLGGIALADKKFCIIAALGLFIIYMGIKWDEADYPLRYDAAKAQKMEQYIELFLKEVQVDKESGISWENTIAYDMGVDFNWLFCITDGIGIQFNLGGYLKDSGNQIKSKYIMMQTESDVCDRMICEKYDLIIKTDDFVVFEKNN